MIKIASDQWEDPDTEHPAEPAFPRLAERSDVPREEAVASVLRQERAAQARLLRKDEEEMERAGGMEETGSITEEELDAYIGNASADDATVERTESPDNGNGAYRNAYAAAAGNGTVARNTLIEAVRRLTDGIDPTQPTDARPGSGEKVKILAARYGAGLSLWHEDDLTNRDLFTDADDAMEEAPAPQHRKPGGQGRRIVEAS